ncbi:hypothetical protein, partial [Staphylococcus felis]|uniref:hypothetical protein n=1 Tax=Staphylococcus felis TaxID=46127 RepID=UPI001EE831AE
DFLQIPLRNGHPCLSLTVPTTTPVTDFHRQDVTHAGRTAKHRGDSIIEPSLRYYFGIGVLDSSAFIFTDTLYI